MKPIRSILLCGAALAFCLAATAVYSHSAQAQPIQPATNKSVSVSYSNTPIRVALTQLFRQVGLNYSLDPSVQGTVTATLKDVPFRVALDSLLNANRPHLVYQVQDGIYQIRARHPAAAARTAAPPGVRPSSATGRQPAARAAAGETVRIPLDYADSALLMDEAFGGGRVIMPSIMGMSGMGMMGGMGMNGMGSMGGMNMGGMNMGTMGGMNMGGMNMGGMGTMGGMNTGGMNTMGGGYGGYR